MSFARLHKVVAYLIAALGLGALTLGEELSAVAASLAFLGVLGSLWAEGPLLHSARYVNWWTGAVVAFLVVQVLRGVAYEPTLALGVEFAAFLQVSRLFNRRGAAEYQQIAVMSFLHLIAATVLSSSLAYAVLFLGFIIVTPWMLALSHLRREIEGNYPPVARQDGEAQTAMARVLASRRVVGPRFLAGTALLSVPLFLMTLTIFFLVPRVGQGFLSFNRSRGDRVAGFGDEVELGGFGVIRDDPEVVLRVSPVPKPQGPPKPLALRMRGTSFDHYDGRRWTRTPAAHAPLPRSGRETYVLRRARERDDLEYRIILDELDEPVLFFPPGTVEFHVDARIVRAQRVFRDITYGPGADIRYEADDDLGVMYNVYVSPKRAEHALRPMGHEERAAYLQLPADHERLAVLAQRITAGASSDYARAARIRTFLHSERFAYSLEQPHVTAGQAPLDVFLFEARKGHCEYFATAMAIMLRSVGVPARNVTGFVGGRYNPFGDYYALRQGDAHSWVEAFVEDKGWVTFDPTPPAQAAAGPSDGLWADVHAMMDAIRTRWVTSVVGYDLRTQRGILRSLARWAASRGGPGKREGPDAQQLLEGSGRTPIVVLAALLPCAAFGAWWWRRRRRHSGGRTASPEEAAAVALYRDLERALAHHGQARPPGRTPLEHASRLAQMGLPGAETVRDVTDGYLRARYAGQALSPTELKRLQAAVADLRRQRRLSNDHSERDASSDEQRHDGRQ